jgi:hypothetical protein
MRTGLIIEKGSEIYDSGGEIKVADAMYSRRPDVQPGHDAMGRIIIEDAEEKHDAPKSADQRRLERQVRRREKEEGIRQLRQRNRPRRSWKKTAKHVVGHSADGSKA